MTPDWLITTVWFVAGISATGGFWYFLASKNFAGTAVSGCCTVAAVTLAIYLNRRNDDLRVGKAVSIPARLLSFVWNYPLIGEQEASWAVKESAALKGDLGSAREKPALGVAIVTTELALAAFGDHASSRIDLCVSWGVGRAEKQPPHRIQVTVTEPIHYEEVEVKTDFRHTLAFAVILARTRKQYDYLASYLRLALDTQYEDGGWPSDSVATVSPVFTAFYAVELLHLTSSDRAVPADLRGTISVALSRGIRWLMEHREPDGLWTSSVLRNFAWDRAFTSAWVLHRLAPTANVRVKGWRRCLDDAAFAMIQQALDPQIWAGVTEVQRHRVESRIAAAAARVSQIPGLSLRTLDAARLYVNSWTERAKGWLCRVPFEEIDVGTAAFLVYALVPEGRLSELGKEVLKTEARDKTGRAM
jgi:hypothetical protein